MVLRAEHLAYFIELLEGRAEVSWNAWFPQHEAELVGALPRADFLRLKFHKLEEAERVLAAAGMSYTPNPAAARRERYYALLHPSVLDERGRPRPEFRRKAYGGAYGQLMDGDFEVARATLAKLFRRLRRRSVDEQAEELEDLCFDGEMEFTLGNPEIGRVLLEAVAAWPDENDQVNPAVHNARTLLASF